MPRPSDPVGFDCIYVGDSGRPAPRILIPGTPSGAMVGGSIMNACFRTTETGELTSSDVTALNALY
ncbi:MAG TPA: M57 family metalloprotease [Kofleriaceae bacterium]